MAIAGAIGAVVRYRIGLAVGVRSFPWATLGINVSGCFLLAFVLAGPATSRWSRQQHRRRSPSVSSGAYTTFSTFGYEAFTLLRTDRTTAALGYMVLSLVGGLAATALGYVAGRIIA